MKIVKYTGIGALALSVTIVPFQLVQAVPHHKIKNGTINSVARHPGNFGGIVSPKAKVWKTNPEPGFRNFGDWVSSQRKHKRIPTAGPVKPPCPKKPMKPKIPKNPNIPIPTPKPTATTPTIPIPTSTPKPTATAPTVPIPTSTPIPTTTPTSPTVPTIPTIPIPTPMPIPTPIPDGGMGT